MFPFIFGFALGSAFMYFGSDKVRENKEIITQLLREQAQCDERIQLLTQQMLIKWIQDGTLIENLKMYEARLSIIYNEKLNPQIWEDARVLSAVYATK